MRDSMRSGMFFGFVLLSFVALTFCGAADVQAEDSPEALAQTAAEAWLALVDTGSYDESWGNAATLFRGAVTKEQWHQAAKGVRQPLGKLISRTLKSRTTKEKLPGAPDGLYVVIQFTTAYENKAKAVETVTPMREADGSWRVSGYFIR